jgi:hypothetical protein
MAKYRPIKTCFWSDEWIASLSPNEKLLYLYLITNERTSLCGIYRLPIQYISFETSLNQQEIEECFKSFYPKVLHKDGWIIIKNFKKHQSASPKIKSGIEREESEIPQEIKEIVYGIDTIPNHIDKPVLKPVLKLKKEISKDIDELDSSSKSFGNEKVNKMLEALRLKIEIEDFKESQSQQRIWAFNLYRLMEKIAPAEFGRRLELILSDDFKHKNCNSLQFVYKEIKGFIEPKTITKF